MRPLVPHGGGDVGPLAPAGRRVGPVALPLALTPRIAQEQQANAVGVGADVDHVEDRVGVAADDALEFALREVVLRAGADEHIIILDRAPEVLPRDGHCVHGPGRAAGQRLERWRDAAAAADGLVGARYFRVRLLYNTGPDLPMI